MRRLRGGFREVTCVSNPLSAARFSNMTAPDPQLAKAVYESTSRAVRAAWPETESAHALLDMVDEMTGHTEMTVDGFRQITGAKVDCMAGCAFCCCLRIDVRAHEVLMLVRWLLANRSPEELGALREKAQTAAASLAGMTYQERGAVRRPCVLLAKDGTCSAYEARPAACRRYLSGDVKACEELWRRTPGEHAIQYPIIEEAGRHSAAALHNEFISRGFDGFSYDLQPALAEALTDTAGSVSRWLGKERVFSADAESWIPEGFSQEETIARLKTSIAQTSLPALPPVNEWRW